MGRSFLYSDFISETIERIAVIFGDRDPYSKLQNEFNFVCYPSNIKPAFYEVQI